MDIGVSLRESEGEMDGWVFIYTTTKIRQEDIEIKSMSQLDLIDYTFLTELDLDTAII